MPIRRKVITVGDSKAVTIPKSWLDLLKEKYGVEITEVKMEVDQKLIIEPIIPKEA